MKFISVCLFCFVLTLIFAQVKILLCYSGGGYVVVLAGSVPVMKEKLKLLQNSSWIDLYTRAVFVEFSTYDVNVSFFVSISKFI